LTIAKVFGGRDQFAPVGAETALQLRGELGRRLRQFRRVDRSWTALDGPDTGSPHRLRPRGTTIMADATRPAIWGNTEAYEAYMGRWSRPAAEAFVAWLALPSEQRWLDVGCGTGALTEAVLAAADPQEVVGLDPSADFIGLAMARIVDPRVRFEIGDARALPMAGGTFDTAVAGFVLNWVPDSEAALAEMARVVRTAGTVGAYVWDYAGEMQLVRTFWQAAAALDPKAGALDQARQFPLCQPAPLAALFRQAGMADVVVDAIDIPTRFRDFDDYWRPHLLPGSASVQRYVASLGEAQRAALREKLQAELPIAADGSIPLIARAWAVRGTK
jgi:SAM-dependent methyltransferase